MLAYILTYLLHVEQFGMIVNWLIMKAMDLDLVLPMEKQSNLVLLGVILGKIILLVIMA